MRLVSCIMPTRGRKEWAAQALNCFLAQTYQDRELIVLDDSGEPSFDSGIAESGVRHYTSDSRRIAIKRNLACAFTMGEIILHWDSDDYSAPNRIEEQVKHLEESGKEVVGYHTMPFYDEDQRKAFLYSGHPHYAVGTSLCYYRSWWQAHPFVDNPKECEDNQFVHAAKACQKIATVPCGQMMVARIHKENTTPKHPHYYKHLPIEELAQGFFE